MRRSFLLTGNHLLPVPPRVGRADDMTQPSNSKDTMIAYRFSLISDSCFLAAPIQQKKEKINKYEIVSKSYNFVIYGSVRYYRSEMHSDALYLLVSICNVSIG